MRPVASCEDPVPVDGDWAPLPISRILVWWPCSVDQGDGPETNFSILDGTPQGEKAHEPQLIDVMPHMFTAERRDLASTMCS